MKIYENQEMNTVHEVITEMRKSLRIAHLENAPFMTKMNAMNNFNVCRERLETIFDHTNVLEIIENVNKTYMFENI